MSCLCESGVIPMDKSVLEQYIDACAQIREIEADIKRLKKRKGVVQDSVRGSNSEFPYQPKSFHLEGTMEQIEDRYVLEEEQRLLDERMAAATRIKMDVEAWMLTIPQRMQRIIDYKIFKKMSWKETADKLGRGATADGVRMEFNNFIKN